MGRVNYILRAIHIAPGSHKVVLSFFPKSVKTTETVAYIAYAILLLIILLGIYVSWRKKQAVK